MTTDEAFEKWFGSLPLPKNVGSSEYRAIYDVLNDTELIREDEPLKMASAILDEFIMHCKALQASIITGEYK